jgi:hypothetical protein
MVDNLLWTKLDQKVFAFLDYAFLMFSRTKKIVEIFSSSCRGWRIGFSCGILFSWSRNRYFSIFYNILKIVSCNFLGRLGIVDFDSVEIGNLHRQIIHKEGSVGKPKAVSAKEAILRFPFSRNSSFHPLM